MTPKDLESLFLKYFSRGVLVDSNLLLLYCVGKYNREIISSFKRTQQYTIEDFDLLDQILGRFKIIFTTPNILTEVSNLSGQFTQKSKSDYFREFGKQIQILDETYLPSKDLCQDGGFSKFGITDTAIAHLARKNYLVLTDELPLANYLQTQGIDVINFNHIRTYYYWS